MTAYTQNFEARLRELVPKMLPFADVATEELPLSRILRLSLFQVSVGMALVLITGSLNRVMIVELSVPAWFVATMIALPVVFAPARALIGYKSDVHKSAFGWRRVPFIWTGTLLQWGGLGIMPFAMLVLSGGGVGPVWAGQLGAGLAFLLVGAGLHTTQTAGLALASDLAKPELRPRVVALLFVMLLVGMVLSALLFGWLLRDFSPVRLIKVVQSAAVITLVLNVIALWKQEVRRPVEEVDAMVAPGFKESWRELREDPRTVRLLTAVALGTTGFAMQDILLEPFGGEILGMSVAATTSLTALLAGGMLVAFLLSARQLGTGQDPNRLAAYGALIGVFAFAIVAIVSAIQIKLLFLFGVALIGLGGGMFGVGTLTAAMALTQHGNSGLALGAWGAVQATATGCAFAFGGIVRDVVSTLASTGAFGPVISGPASGYTFVYHLEVLLLFATLIVIGPLAAFTQRNDDAGKNRLGLAEFPS
ncbi:MAG: BCD family MFS transporter [Woeseiaceae bacterium]|nr:BCD family MFS transporter [Woeseiaceae bacterium]